MFLLTYPPRETVLPEKCFGLEKGGGVGPSVQKNFWHEAPENVLGLGVAHTHRRARREGREAAWVPPARLAVSRRRTPPRHRFANGGWPAAHRCRPAGFHRVEVL